MRMDRQRVHRRDVDFVDGQCEAAVRIECARPKFIQGLASDQVLTFALGS